MEDVKGEKQFNNRTIKEIEMKALILIANLFFLIPVPAQTIYELTPGTKGNEISLTVANVSETDQASNVSITLTRKSSSINFSKESETIELIEAKTEAEANFKFDVNRNASINKKDTIDFIITDGNGIMTMKSFIFKYTGPKEFKLEQNFPNPFNPSTTIQYQLPFDARVSLKVYDILGSEVVTLVNEEQEAGYKEVKFSTGSFGNATNLASGMYIYRLTADKYSSTKKMILLR